MWHHLTVSETQSQHSIGDEPKRWVGPISSLGRSARVEVDDEQT